MCSSDLLPANAHPLHDTDYMRSVSSDGFGICIESSDPSFEEKQVKAFLEDLGGQDIQVIRQPYKAKPSYLSSLIFLGVLGAIVVGVSGKTYFIFNKVLYSAPFTWMETQQKVTPQGESSLFKDGRSMQLPVPGTVARGYKPYQFKKRPADAGVFLANPLIADAATLTRGKQMYQIHCSSCHGDFGKGDGSVSSRESAKALRPPSLHSKKLKEYSDGSIYHVIMEGQNAMPSYAKQVMEEDRWAIILYIRALQRAVDAKESDLQ